MIDLSKVSASDWVAMYGGVLSTLIVVVATWRFIANKLNERRELRKFQTDLYFLRKIDRASQEVHPIVVVLLANLGTARISFKSLDFEGINEGGLKTQGGMGWYEQPEELFGIRNRLLPCILESGQTGDLPMVQIGVISRIRDLKIWLTDFDNHRIYIEEKDIEKVRRDIDKYLETNKVK